MTGYPADGAAGTSAELLLEVLSATCLADRPTLRRLRVRVLPHLAAEVEGFTWFHPWVAGRGPEGLIIDPERLHDLRQRLLERDWADLAFAEVSALRAAAPPLVRLGDELISLGLSQEIGVDERVERLWQRLLATILPAQDAAPEDEPERRRTARQVCRWILRLEDLLPPQAVQGRTAGLLLAVSRSVLTGSTSSGSGVPEPPEVAHLAERVFGTRTAGVSLTRGGVSVSLPPEVGAHRLPVPGTFPVALTVSRAGGAPDDAATLFLTEEGTFQATLVGHIPADGVRVQSTTGPWIEVKAGFRHAVMPGLRYEPRWYQRAVFYEVSVRAYSDSTGSGVGDFRGLIRAVDHIQTLGADCVLLMPFQQSPLRDGGYDISDHNAVLPEYGTVQDVGEFVGQAHARGLRVVIDLVVNHTSDTHPWFQASRSDPEGPYGDFYVWSDARERYQDAPVLLPDVSGENWTFDPVRRQYYWHRFHSHEPDLNFENPAVVEEMDDVVRFWLDMGIDGLRLIGVPYLYEEEGTRCENLPQTHAFLRRLRALVDTEFPSRVLMADVGSRPGEGAAYFGTDEDPECHLVQNPLPGRALHALREELAQPLIEWITETPDVPRHGSWSVPLGGPHGVDLYTFESEGLAAMYGWYAPDPRMALPERRRIRRRLASLLDGSRYEVELYMALLLAVPGSPTLYYGDEIGMGDNIWLADLDSVRTPMQWTPDKNGGFSAADAGKLYLPAVQSLVYHYAAVNVEAQSAVSTSLLNWVRAMLAIRRGLPALGLGEFIPLESVNAHVFAFLRHLEADEDLDDDQQTVLCVYNLSSQPQATRIRMPDRAGHSIEDVFGGTGFESVPDDGWLSISTGSRDFFWLRLNS